MSARLFAALPLLGAIVLLGAGGAPIYWPLAFAALALASIVLRARWKLETFGALLVMIGGATPAVLWTRATTLEIGLALPITLILLGIAIARSFLAEPRRGFDRLIVGLACIAEGIGVKSALYPYGVVVIALLLLADQAGGVAALRAFARTKRASAILVPLAGALFVAGVVLLPVIDRATNRSFRSLYEGRLRRTAFSAHVRLDQPGLINQNEEIVLRLRGGDADYLRGAVFDSFDGDYWTTSRRPLQPDPDPRTTGDVTWVEAAEPSTWLFAPRAAKITSDTTYKVDGLGTLRPAEPRGATRWAFARAALERIDPPGAQDTTLPVDVVADVRPLALAWTVGARDDRARVDAIASHLVADFTYTLDRPAPPAGTPPLHDFLFVHRTGHCEFFASAFVVLARSLGIPARLVAGFRVVEHNGFGGYAVVRAKHAHAWAEIYVPRADGEARFETFDATPPVETLSATDPRDASAFFDWLKWRARELYDDAVARPERSIAVLGGIVAIALLARWVRRRRAGASGAGALYDEAPEAFVKFEAMLAARGYARKPAETLDELAKRLDEAREVAFAKALRRYAKMRYGPGEASATELSATLKVHAESG